MTVVNYAFQETFGNNQFMWEGTRWFKQILVSERFHAARKTSLFTLIILVIQIPLGIFIALTMQKNRGSNLFSINVNATFDSLECCRSYVEYFCTSRYWFSWSFIKCYWI